MSKQRMLSVIFVIILFLNCTNLTMPHHVEAKENKMYTTTNVIVREEPDINSKKIKSLKVNTKVVVIEKYDSKWSKIRFESKEGYVCTKYLSHKKRILNRWKISLNNKEVTLLSKIVYHEARGECNKGQQAVAEVVLNRIRSKKFSNTLRGVVSQPGQFASYKLINRKVNKREYNVCKRNVKKVLNGNTNILSKKYLYFSMGGHNRHKGVKRIGCHQFCRTY